MAQKIKVQDGSIVYSSTDPGNPDVNLQINGLLDVTKEVNVGNDPLANGEITTPVDVDLEITVSGTGKIKLQTGSSPGGIVLNNIEWPPVDTIPTPGNFLAVSSINTLSYELLVLGHQDSDILTSIDLDLLYPGAIPGQIVSGNTVIYTCISLGQWVASAGALGYVPVNKAGDTMSGLLLLSADPVSPLGAVTKQYADAIAAGINVHAACVTGTTESLAISSGGTITYDNGSGGFGAVLSTTGSFSSIGGTTLSVGNRVLVKNESTQTHNGVYVYNSSTLLTRATDFDNSPSGEIVAGDSLYIEQGTLLGTTWAQITTGTIIIGTSPLVFTQIGGNASRPIAINTQPSDYMLQLSDAYDTLIRITKATPAVVTIPNDSTINMPIGSAPLISWNGIGQVSIGYEAGVTVDTPDTYNIGKQFGKITAIKVGPNHWEIEGNLEPL